MGEKKMAESMLRKEIEVYSQKYDIKGVIRDYGVVVKLFFTYQGRDIEIALDVNPLECEKYELTGQQIIDFYISNLATEHKKISLYDWYIDEHVSEKGKYCVAHGIVTGHDRLPDSCYCHTSKIRTIYVNFEENELVVITRNTIYHCPLEYCRWKEQDEYAHVIPDYAKIKEQYKDKIPYPSIETGNVLLVLSNFCEYYFHSVYYVPKDATDQKPRSFRGYPHIGTFQDSYLISVEHEPIDLRYFPHYQNVEFYAERTNNMPLFIENIGDVVLYAKTSAGIIKLAPGERKEVIKENAEDNPPALPKGDLYPAGIIE